MKAVTRLPGLFFCIAFAAAFNAGLERNFGQGTQGAQTQPQAGAQPQPEVKLYIREFRVQGAHKLPRIEVEQAVYPFMGPARTADDVEKARQALEQAYKDKGFQTVTVEVPQQQALRGVVVLQVTEMPVGRLRVHGSRYFSLEDIKRQAPSLAEGTVPNFNDVTRDVVALNQLPDRRVTPVLKAGVLPGTVDIDLQVKDTPPLHGSIELNNRYSLATTELRLDGGLSYSNLWQLGHSAGFNFEIAPQNLEDAKVYSAYYTARFPQWQNTTFTIQGVKQDSTVSTLGGTDSLGRGEVLGLRWGQVLPAPMAAGFFHSINAGIDYKHFAQGLTDRFGSPIPAKIRTIMVHGKPVDIYVDLPWVTYYPLTLGYNASYTTKSSQTNFDASLNFSLRPDGDGWDFEVGRYKAQKNYIYLRGDLSHNHDLPGGFEIYGKIQGQIADQPLIANEQFSGGGLNTVRGYLESTALGDNALFGTVELRSPSLLGWWKRSEKVVDEWRVYGFFDGGVLTLNQTLIEQDSHFNLASVGFGSRLRLANHLNGSIDVGFPLVGHYTAQDMNPMVTFRAGADF